MVLEGKNNITHARPGTQPAPYPFAVAIPFCIATPFQGVKKKIFSSLRRGAKPEAHK
jgi:hypothetical protein